LGLYILGQQKTSGTNGSKPHINDVNKMYMDNTVISSHERSAARPTCQHPHTRTKLLRSSVSLQFAH